MNPDKIEDENENEDEEEFERLMGRRKDAKLGRRGLAGIRAER